MGLIERAIGGNGAGELIAAPAPFTNIEGSPFDIDRAALKSKGVFVGGDAPTTQAYELRAIKRRLLRRIGFLQRAGRDPRLARSSGRNRNIILLTSTRPG